MQKFVIMLLFLSSTCQVEPSTPQSVQLNQQVVKEEVDVVEPHRNRNTTGEQYLTISKVQNLPDQKIAFDISWDASWRVGNEYDAAWIFIKSKSKNGEWFPALIQPTRASISTNLSSDLAVPEIKISQDQLGMMIHRKNNSGGDNHWQVVVQLDLPSDFTPTEYRVLGLEMVHVAPGPFELGTLKSERQRREVLTPGAGGAPYDPFFTYQKNARNNYGGIFKVTSEAPINIGEEDGYLYWVDANIPGTNTFSGIPEGILETNFPKGVNGFFQMKYELSQQEYCDFLNTLTPSQQQARDITKVMEFDRPISDYRNAMAYQKGQFSTNRPHRPCNFLSWLDGQAYADWAGLRHMTELEFEKSCRGPKEAIYREYVWGVNEIKEKSNMQYSATFYEGGKITKEEWGKEVTDGNIHASMFSYRNFIDVCTPEGNFYDPDCLGCRSFTGGDGGRGPVRKGIFAKTSNGDRIKAGATYYGAMEMGGNLQEPVVAVGHPSGRKFEGSHGDGKITIDGFATNPDWQPINKEYAFGGRGGCWKFHENHARTSDRFKGLRTNPNRRASHIGFRGVRTAWE